MGPVEGGDESESFLDGGAGRRGRLAVYVLVLAIFLPLISVLILSTAPIIWLTAGKSRLLVLRKRGLSDLQERERHP